MKCFLCRHSVFWESDVDNEDIGLVKDGITSFYKCSNEYCNAFYQATVNFEDQKAVTDQ